MKDLDLNELDFGSLDEFVITGIDTDQITKKIFDSDKHPGV